MGYVLLPQPGNAANVHDVMPGGAHSTAQSAQPCCVSASQCNVYANAAATAAFAAAIAARPAPQMRPQQPRGAAAVARPAGPTAPPRARTAPGTGRRAPVPLLVGLPKDSMRAVNCVLRAFADRYNKEPGTD
eukprot:gene35484-35467_t